MPTDETTMTPTRVKQLARIVRRLSLPDQLAEERKKFERERAIHDREHVSCSKDVSGDKLK